MLAAPLARSCSCSSAPPPTARRRWCAPRRDDSRPPAVAGVAPFSVYRRPRRRRRDGAHDRRRAATRSSAQLDVGQATSPCATRPAAWATARAWCCARASPGSLKVDGQTVTFDSPSLTVDELLATYNVDARRRRHHVAVARLRARRRRRRCRSCASAPRRSRRTETIPFGEETVADPTIPIGETRELAAGVDGDHDRHVARRASRTASRSVAPCLEGADDRADQPDRSATAPRPTGTGTRSPTASRAGAGTPSTAGARRLRRRPRHLPRNWRHYGGLEFAPNAGLATREQQIIVGMRIYDELGWDPWGCANGADWRLELTRRYRRHVRGAAHAGVDPRAACDAHRLDAEEEPRPELPRRSQHRAPDRDAGRGGAGRRGARDRSRARLAHPRAARARARTCVAVELDARLAAVLADVLGPDADADVVADVPRRRGDAARTVDLDALLVPAPAPVGRACRTSPTTSPSRWWSGCSKRRPTWSASWCWCSVRWVSGWPPAPGDAQYGAVSVKVAYYAEASLSGVVPPTVFVPAARRSTPCWCALRPPRRAAGRRAVGRRACSRSCAAGSRSGARCCGGRSRRCSATARARRCSTPPGDRAHGAGRDARARRMGRACARGQRRWRRESSPASAPPRTRSSRCRCAWSGRRDDGFHDLESLVVSLGQPHDVLEAYAVPAPGGVQVELSRDDRRRRPGIPTDHTNLAFIAAEKLLVRAGRSGHGVRIVLRKRIPAGAGLGGGSADAAAALLAVRRLLDVDVDDAGVLALAAAGRAPTCRSACAAARRGCAAAARSSSRSLADRAGVPRRHPAVPPVDARRVPRLGQARRPPVGAGASRAAAARGRSCPSCSTTSSPPPRRSSRGWSSSGPRSRRRPARPALLAGSGSAYVVPVNDAARPAAARRARWAAASGCRWSARRASPAASASQLTRSDEPASASAMTGSDRRRFERDGLAALLATLPARALQQLLVLLLPHALAALLDQ